MANPVDRYSIISRMVLGSGAEGEVVLGKNNDTQSPVAVKTVRAKHFSRDRTDLHQALTGCDHLVACREDFALQGKHYIVMDLADGKNVQAAYLEKNIPMPNEDVKSLVFQTLEFLNQLSYKGFIFHDLKPANMIWLSKARTLKMVDLGAVLEIGKPRLNDGVTPAYAPPDFLLGKPYSHEFDLWSLGCVIYGLFCGVPFIPANGGLNVFDLVAQSMRIAVTRIGNPTPEYLKECRSYSRYLNADGTLLLPISTSIKPWKEEFLAAMQRRQVPQEERGQWLQLMERLLSYNNRGTAAEHLQNPLFKSETQFHLSYNTAIKCKLYIQRASLLTKHLDKLQPRDLEGADIFVDFARYKGRCLHIPKDPNDQYLVLVAHQGSFNQQLCQINSGNVIDITDQQVAVLEQVQQEEEELSPTAPEESFSPSKPARDVEELKNDAPSKKAKTDTVIL